MILNKIIKTPKLQPVRGQNVVLGFFNYEGQKKNEKE